MLDKTDIELLEKAKEEGKTLDEVIFGAKEIVSKNELKEKIEKVGKNIYYNFNQILAERLDEIIKMEDEEEIINFIVKESYKQYKEKQDLIDIENKPKLEKK